MLMPYGSSRHAKLVTKVGTGGKSPIKIDHFSPKNVTFKVPPPAPGGGGKPPPS